MDCQWAGKKQPAEPDCSMLPHFCDSVLMYLFVCAKKIKLPVMGDMTGFCTFL